MTLAEKHYRKWHKIDAAIKLTNEQFKEVRMMHECLREYNKPKLPVGAMLTNRVALIAHLRTVDQYLNHIDEIMKEPSNGIRGGKIAKAGNELRMSLHSIKHFELKIALERLNDDIDSLIPITPTP